MAFLYGGGRPTGKDCLRDYQRQIASNARGMEREVARMDLQEKALQRDLVKCANENKIDAATLKAREVVRLRAHRSRVQTMRGHMVGLSQQLQTVQSTSKIQETVALTARMLQGLNARCDAASIARMLAEFEKQNILMANKQEVVEDTLDCTFEVDGEHDATSDAVASVLQEVGLDVQSKFKAQAVGEAWKNTQEEDDMAERLQRLRPRD